jgi:hypothetical protein
MHLISRLNLTNGPGRKTFNSLRVFIRVVPRIAIFFPQKKLPNPPIPQEHRSCACRTCDRAPTAWTSLSSSMPRECFAVGSYSDEIVSTTVRPTTPSMTGTGGTGSSGGRSPRGWRTRGAPTRPSSRACRTYRRTPLQNRSARGLDHDRARLMNWRKKWDDTHGREAAASDHGAARGCPSRAPPVWR